MGLENPIHLAFLLVILLMVFGAKRLPEMGRSLGSGLRGFKETINGETTTHGRHDHPGADRRAELDRPGDLADRLIDESRNASSRLARRPADHVRPPRG